LRARLDFNPQAINRTDVVLLAGYVENVLAQVAENIQELVCKIDLLDSETRRLIIHDWNQTQRTILDNRPFPVIFHERINQHASRIALRQGSRELTFERLKHLVNAYSLELYKRGVGPESVVAVTADPCIESVVGILAVLHTGAAFLPVDAAYARERLEWILEQSGATIMICPPDEEANFQKGTGTPIAIDTHLAVTDFTPTISPPSYEQNAAYVIYTSGSTGQPKGVVVSHGSLSNYLDWCLREYTKSGSGCALHSSLAFDLSITSLLAPLLLGESVRLPYTRQRSGYLPSLLDKDENYL
jgi:non-ribosomal peptide synthetase component F